LLPWISVYVYDGNLFNAPDDPNLFKTVAVGNSISGGARVAAAIFGLILIGLATAIQFTPARSVVARRRAYEGYAKPRLSLADGTLSGIVQKVWRHAIPGNRQRLLRTIERRFPTPNLSRRRSRCDSIVCQDWTLSNSTSWNIA
jgi:hypothetical protein